MKSLREEIYDFLNMSNDGIEAMRMTNVIFSKIEKRIDSIIQDLDKQLIGSRPSDNEKEYTLKDVIARTSVNLGNIKKEILK